MGRLALALAVLCAAPLAARADAPGAPGEKPTWTTGRKFGTGTAAGLSSRVWFTLGERSLTEVYWPSIDTAQLRTLELCVVGPSGRLERESDDQAVVGHTELDDPAASSLSY